MESVQEWASSVAIIDALALIFLLLGAVLGILRGLGPVFGMLLWLLVALWIAGELGPIVLGWMPNTADPTDPAARFSAYGVLCATFLGLPILARLLGGTSGRKKDDPLPQYRFFGVLVAEVCAVLLFVLVLPYAARAPFLAKGYQQALSPGAGLVVADSLTWLFPPAHRDELGRLLAEAPDQPAPAAASTTSR